MTHWFRLYMIREGGTCASAARLKRAIDLMALAIVGVGERRGHPVERGALQCVEALDHCADVALARRLAALAAAAKSGASRIS